jgi:hypothetical protein
MAACQKLPVVLQPAIGLDASQGCCRGLAREALVMKKPAI